MRLPVKAGIIAVIRAYQRFLSPFIPANCRYIPTCSEYMLTAIQQYGTGRGLWLGIKRMGRCHPLGGHGYDPVPQYPDRAHPDTITDGPVVESSTSPAGSHNSNLPGGLTGRKSNNG